MDSVRKALGRKSLHLDGLHIHWEASKLDVQFETGRHHKIRYTLSGEHILFRATVASAHQLETLAASLPPRRRADFHDRLCREILLQNQHTESVCFRMTPRGKVEAVIAQRADTLDHDEVVYYATQLAREADRFEALLNERDRW